MRAQEDLAPSHECFQGYRWAPYDHVSWVCIGPPSFLEESSQEFVSSQASQEYEGEVIRAGPLPTLAWKSVGFEVGHEI